METMKTVGIRELKNNLSAYLREVKHGVKILVTEHNRVIAKLVEPNAQENLSPQEALREQWIREGRMTPGNKSPQNKFDLKPIAQMPEGTALRLLDEEREE